MSYQLLTNANLIRLIDPADYGQIERAAVVVSDGDIEWVGNESDLPARYDARFADDVEVTDCDGMLLTPGLIDCHTHLVYGGNRAAEFEQRLQGVSYIDISRAGGGIMNTVRATRQADEEELISQSRPRLREMLSEGITTIEIKSGYGLETNSEIKMLQAARRLAAESGVRVKTTFLGAHALPPEFSDDPDGYIDLVCEEMLPAAVGAGVVDAVDAFCENIGFTVPQVERVFDKADTFGLPIKCHAEQLTDSGSAVMSASRGALSVDHLEYLSEKDTGILAEHRTVAVLLPGAFYVLGETQLPPISALREKGVDIAVATDANPGSSPLFSPLLTMNMACTLFGLTPLESIAGFTIVAARALGIENEVGSIETGKRADLALWRCQHPAELCYHIGLNPCAGVMQGGQWRLQPKT